MIVVPDAGPLIYIAGAGHVELLRLLYDDVVVPRIVFDEVTVVGVGLTGAAEVSAATWIRVLDRAADPALAARLDPGEAAAIPLAEELGAVLLADDGEARAVAAERGLRVVGSLGVLVSAKRAGHLSAVGPVMERMMKLGMFVAPALKSRVLTLAGEGPGG